MRLFIQLHVVFVLWLLTSCDNCDDGRVSKRAYKLPDYSKIVFDSLSENWYDVNSNMGRNDRVNVIKIQSEDGLRWAEKERTDCILEIGEVKTLSYNSALYGMTFNISLKVNRDNITLLYVNPDYEDDNFRRMVVINPLNIKDSGNCSYHYCLQNIYSNCRLVNRDWLVGEIGDSVVQSFYKFHSKIQIGPRSYNNCIELTFDNGKVTGPNAIRKIWFTLNHGIIKFHTQSDEEWVIAVD